MYQEWHHLLFLHWPVDARALRPLVPPPLEIDSFDGQTYIGLVLFTMTGVRHRFTPPLPGISAFHEFNVRTYVRHGDQKGVWFFSLDAASRAAVCAARRHYSLPYHYARMAVDRTDGAATYRSARVDALATVDSAAKFGGPVWHAEPESLDHFLIERYRLFSGDQGDLLTLQVRHAPYPLRTVTDVDVDECLCSCLGVHVEGQPIAHFSDGVSSQILGLERCSA